MSTPSALDVTTLQADIGREFPDFKMVPKSESWMMKVIAAFLFVCSFGKTKFLQQFTTTIGHTIYLPVEWSMYSPTAQCGVLRHERVHMRQQKRMGRFVFSFLYLIPYFPVFFARGRCMLEMEAYEESMRALHEYGGDIQNAVYKERMVQNFIGPAYLWMWPFRGSVEKWFDMACSSILGGPQ